MATLVRRSASYEDLLRHSRLPVAEIVDGSLYRSARPSVPCAMAAFALSAAIGAACAPRRAQAGGWWVLFEPELQLGDDVLVPDLAGWRRERLSAREGTVAVDVAPDWVCEILAPGTEAFDREHKLPAYARHGVSHAWLVDPARRSLQVLEREARRWVRVRGFEEDARVRAEPFAAVELDLLTLWADTAPSLAPA